MTLQLLSLLRFDCLESMRSGLELVGYDTGVFKGYRSSESCAQEGRRLDHE